MIPPTGRELLSLLSTEQLASLLDSNPSFKGYFQGYISERILTDSLLRNTFVRSVTKIRDQDPQKGDLVITLDTGRTFTIEAKTAYRRKKGWCLEGGDSGNIRLKTTGSIIRNGTRSAHIAKGKFDVLAISMINITGSWNYYYILNKYIPLSLDFPEFLTQSFSINTDNTPFLRSEISDIIKDLG